MSDEQSEGGSTPASRRPNASPSQLGAPPIQLGDAVDITTDSGATTVVLVRPVDADYTKNRISSASPLGRSLLEANVGDRVEVVTPAGCYTCLIQGRRRGVAT